MFERFSSAAREAMVHAQEEARSLGHNYIGTEHLLLSLLQAGGDNLARDTLNDRGIGYDRVRNDVLAIVGPGEGTPAGHIPFTPRSKKVLELSLREALRLGHNAITPGHLLLGIIREGEGMAAQLLTKEGVDLQQLRAELIGVLAPEGRVRRGRFGRGRMARVPDPRVSRMTRGGAGVADRAVSLAGDAPVASQHYLLAALDEKESLAARVLGALGVTREAVEAKLAEVGLEGTSDEPPEVAGARATSLSIEGDTVEVRIEAPALSQQLTHLMEAQRAAVLRGPDLPASERIWNALQPILGDVVKALESQHGPAWTPPGWPDEVTVAAYAVSSQPGGPQSALKVADGVDEQAVRAWLAESLVTEGFPGPQRDALAFVMVEVGRTGDVVPDAVDPDEWTIVRLASGAGPAPADWPRRPLDELIAFALADLAPAA